MDLSVRVTVSYSANPELARDVLAGAACACEGIAATPPPAALLDDFAENGYAFLVRARSTGYNQPEEAASALRFAIVRALKLNDIEIAVPQSDIRWRDLDFARKAFTAAMAQRPVIKTEPGE